MTKARENDKEFVEAIQAMWHEAFEARQAAWDATLRPESTEADKLAYLLAQERQQAMWEAYDAVYEVVMARHDRELAELRGEG